MEQLVGALHERGIPTRVAWTLEEHRLLVEAANADPSCRGLVCVGGDGTVSHLVNQRLNSPLAVLPAGTENLFARHFRFPSDPRRSARMLANAHPRVVDLGCANDRLFVLMAGFGFDAAVVTRHHAMRLRRTGQPRPTSRAAYVEPILRSSLEYRFPKISVRVDDGHGPRVISGSTVLFFNVPLYALGLSFAPGARDDDGLLDVVIFRKPGAWQALRYLWLVMMRAHLARRSVFHCRTRAAEVWSEARVPVQLDGDPAGFLEAGEAQRWGIECRAGALQVLASLNSGESGTMSA